MEKKEKRGSKKGVSRGSYKNTTVHKPEKVLGYRYTKEEAELIRSVLEKAKEQHGTTSKAILEVFKAYQN